MLNNYFSDNVLGVTGYSGAEINDLERGWESLILKDDLPSYRKKLDEFENETEKEHLKLEYRITKKNKEIAAVSERINVFRDPSGKANRKFGLITDITEYSSEIKKLSSKIEELKQAIIDKEAKRTSCCQLKPWC